LRTALYFMFDNAESREMLITKLISLIESNPFLLQDEDIQKKKKEYLMNKKAQDRIAFLLQNADETNMEKFLEESRKIGVNMENLLIMLHFEPNERVHGGNINKLKSNVKAFITFLINSSMYTFDDLLRVLRHVVEKKDISSYIARSGLLILKKLNKAVTTNPENTRLAQDKERIMDEVTDVMRRLIEKHVWENGSEIWEGVKYFFQSTKNRERSQKILNEIRDNDPEAKKMLEEGNLLPKLA